jgi:hypothetical protein
MAYRISQSAAVSATILSAGSSSVTSRPVMSVTEIEPRSFSVVFPPQPAMPTASRSASRSAVILLAFILQSPFEFRNEYVGRSTKKLHPKFEAQQKYIWRLHSLSQTQGVHV